MKYLKHKLKKLKNSNKIPESIYSVLLNLKVIGDDAAHKLIQSSYSHLGRSIDLLEALLTHLYEAKFDLEKKLLRLKNQLYIKPERKSRRLNNNINSRKHGLRYLTPLLNPAFLYQYSRKAFCFTAGISDDERGICRDDKEIWIK
jgi:hypothetical protein